MASRHNERAFPPESSPVRRSFAELCGTYARTQLAGIVLTGAQFLNSEELSLLAALGDRLDEMRANGPLPPKLLGASVELEEHLSRSHALVCLKNRIVLPADQFRINSTHGLVRNWQTMIEHNDQSDLPVLSKVRPEAAYTGEIDLMLDFPATPQVVEVLGTAVDMGDLSEVAAALPVLLSTERFEGFYMGELVRFSITGEPDGGMSIFPYMGPGAYQVKAFDDAHLAFIREWFSPS